MGYMQGYLAAQDSIASTRLKEQMAQENVMKLDEQRRMLEENARSRDIQTKAYNAPQEYKTLEIPNATPAAVAPQGLVPTQATPQLIPQAGATGLGGMTIPQVAPVGMQPTENLGGMQPIAPVGMTQQPAPVQPAAPTGVQQTTETAPATIMNKVQESAKTVRVAESEIQKVQRVADELHKAGLHDQANAYLEKQAGVIKNVEAAKDSHLKNTVAMAERAASLGNGYLETIKAGGDPNAAWAELLIKASADGYPIESLLTVVDPRERIAKATEIINNAETTKQRAQMEREVYKEAGRTKRATDAAEVRYKTAQMSTQRAAANQAAIKERWKEGQDFQKYKTSLANFETNVKNAQRDRDDYDTQISEIDKKIADINNLTNLSIPKEERPAAVEALRQQRETISSARSSADRDVKEQETALQELQKSGKLFDGKEAKAPSEKTNLNIPSKEDVKTILDAINTSPDKLEVIKANFAKLHPGVSFEKYVKVNPQSKAFKK